MRYLVIVESPTKSKTISKYLGKNYIVKSTMGHVRDIPNKFIKNKSNFSNIGSNIGIEPYNKWFAHYLILPDKQTIVNNIKKLSNTVNHIYLATDMDREGEAIAWHLKFILGEQNRYSRILFNEITEKSIKEAFNNPIDININKVHAQQTRRFMDRIVGYMISPLLWKKISPGLSAGRVQSVAVRLIVDREREIRLFVPKENWKLYVRLETHENHSILAKITHYNGTRFEPDNKEKIQSATIILKKSNFYVSNIKKQSILSKSLAPFTTSTLQQSASILLGYNVNKTMLIAQQLYELGYISYIRTDSTHINQDTIKMARHYIFNSFGQNYLPDNPNIYYNKRQCIQEAHEAIRPSDINITLNHPKIVKFNHDMKNLYQLIWSRFIASQVVPAQYERTLLTIYTKNFQLLAEEDQLRFDGWTRILPILSSVSTLKKRVDSSSNHDLSSIQSNSILKLNKVISKKTMSKPPLRYSEASLVKELEKRGIGRPSTYSAILSTIKKRGYVRLENKVFYTNKIGEIVNDRLVENFPELMNYNFTADMENTLDEIASNKKIWRNVLDNFFEKFCQQLHKAEKNPNLGGMCLNLINSTNIKCSFCEKKMGLITINTGTFIQCLGYTRIPKICKNSKLLLIQKRKRMVLNPLLCPKCHIRMDDYLIDHTKLYISICSNYPMCKEYFFEHSII
ncbi:type I DNA topoisomerase [Candidatus Schneideria nysicola]|uniref:type I DNA topoisomerase n=1 Tax=Candidatus Schneideria nysicola TaxID=1081631 RepID=UPI001CAA603E|nr:type I DNA topoisomerase [Candidatus Schneideria nysicola]UAJ65576.1 type I DNA topoisomerase [Candidatus Schneideria nysicola]